MPSLEKVDIYKIIVEPYESITWEGLFNFKPSVADVIDAIRQDISELDPETEYEFDMIQGLRQTLELMTLHVTTHVEELSREVKIAGTFVGDISLSTIEVFGKEEQSASPMTMLNLPELRSDRVPELTDTSELIDVSELVQQRADAGQFGGEQPDEYSAEALEELVTTDPRTGEKWPSAKIQTSEGEITLTESQRRNLASEHMRGGEDF